jgi:hypothetical protein
MFTVAEKRRHHITPSREQYVVTKDYTDPFSGEKHKAGDVLSNRQGRNVQAQEQTNYRSVSQYQNVWGPRAKPTKDEVKNRNAWLRSGAKKTGKDPNTLRNDPKVRAAWIQLYQIDKGKKDLSATGNTAQLLVALGLRNKDATYRVGDTPKG